METILSIAGKPGLYKLVSRGNRNLIVETLDETHKRIPAFATDRVTSLGDIAMYTDADEVPLWEVLDSVSKKEGASLALSTTRRRLLLSSTLILLRFFQTTIATVFMTAISRSSSSGTTFLLSTASPISRLLSLLQRVRT